jgi:hypothetical protein
MTRFTNYIMIIIVAIFILLASGSCKHQRAGVLPVFTVDSTVNLGNINYKDTAYFNVVLKNIGKQKFLISDINTSCGCLHYKYQNTYISPSGTLSVQFIFKPPCQGYIEQNIFIYIDKLSIPIHVIMKARVK